MEDTAKYLIHATIAADGVVERSDVVGAVFGQTEGLLGDELDLRDLQQSSKVGRIDVAIESENGQSFGEVTVASSLDKVETAILGAALETITRVGPCHASIEVTSIEDVRAAKRREIVDRAKELLAGGFEETSLSSDEILEEVRDAARVEGIADYEGLPAGPRVGDSDAVIVVEGRADVLTLLDCGIKNAVAVEGTNVPDAVAELSTERTVTAFLDGDRGGELILRELAQVGSVDYVAFAPAGQSVEDLDRSGVFEALRAKVPYESLADEPNLREAANDEPPASDPTATATPDTPSDDGVTPDDESPLDREGTPDDEATADGDAAGEAAAGDTDAPSEAAAGDTDDTPAAGSPPESAGEPTDDAGGAMGNGSSTEAEPGGSTDHAPDAPPDEPRTVREHVEAVIGGGTGTARLLDDDGDVLAEVDVAEAFDAVENGEPAPHAVVVDGEVTQRLLDVAAQRGVAELFGRTTGEFVKKPIGTRVRTAAELQAEA